MAAESRHPLCSCTIPRQMVTYPQYVSVDAALCACSVSSLIAVYTYRILTFAQAQLRIYMYVFMYTSAKYTAFSRLLSYNRSPPPPAFPFPGFAHLPRLNSAAKVRIHQRRKKKTTNSPFPHPQISVNFNHVTSCLNSRLNNFLSRAFCLYFFVFFFSYHHLLPRFFTHV